MQRNKSDSTFIAVLTNVTILDFKFMHPIVIFYGGCGDIIGPHLYYVDVGQE